MYPNGVFGLEALQLLISPIAIFGILFFLTRYEKPKLLPEIDLKIDSLVEA